MELVVDVSEVNFSEIMANGCYFDVVCEVFANF
jgi:hypothetical protein